MRREPQIFAEVEHRTRSYSVVHAEAPYLALLALASFDRARDSKLRRCTLFCVIHDVAKAGLIEKQAAVSDKVGGESASSAFLSRQNGLLFPKGLQKFAAGRNRNSQSEKIQRLMVFSSV